MQSTELLKQLSKLLPCLRGNVMSRGQQKLRYFGDIPLYNRLQVTYYRLQVVHRVQHHTNIVHSEQSKSAACLVWVHVCLLQRSLLGTAKILRSALATA